jgi:hypothetical protein
MPQSQLFIVIYLGCAVGWSTSIRMSVAAASHSRGASVFIAPVLLVAAAGCLAAAALPELGARLRHEPSAAQAAEKPGTTRWPRLWQDGYF